MTADTREVILATIRGRLLDDDVNVLRLDPDEEDRHTWSIAEHALDAALARGIGLADVHAAAAVELARIDTDVLGLERVDADPEGDGLFEEQFDRFADVPLDRFGVRQPEAFDHYPPPQTLGDLRRMQTLRLLCMLSLALGARATRRVQAAFTARMRELGLDQERTTYGEVFAKHERVELFTAGLYGDDEHAGEAPAGRGTT